MSGSDGFTQSQPIVEPVVFRGRTVSSLRRSDGRNYLLLEAVCRVFFPTLSIDAFVNCVEQVLHVPVGELTDEEQRYFIEFYRLPTNCLRCRKLIRADDFEKFYPQIEYSFRPQQQSPGATGLQPNAAVTVGTVFIQSSDAAQSATAEQSSTVKNKRMRKKVFNDVIIIDD
jgi:hypothetical protein